MRADAIEDRPAYADVRPASKRHAAVRIEPASGHKEPFLAEADHLVELEDLADLGADLAGNDRHERQFRMEPSEHLRGVPCHHGATI